MTSLPEALEVRRLRLDGISVVLTLRLARVQADYGQANMTEDRL